MNEVQFWVLMGVMVADAITVGFVLMRLLDFEDKFDAYLAKYHKRRSVK
jgi:hypothetical protein